MTITQYITELPEDRQADIKALHQLIKKHAPKLKPFLLESPSGTFIGYGKYDYKTTSGCSGEWFTVGLSNRKGHISLYVPCTKEGQDMADKYRKQLAPAKVGKSCINIKRWSDMDEPVIISMLKEINSNGVATSWY